MAVTALRSKISWRVCGRFRPQAMHLLPSWEMTLLSPGAVQARAVTALQSKIAEECAAGSGHTQCICCHRGRWLCCHLGQSTLWRWQLCGPRSAEECAAGSGHMVCICCHLGRWLCCHLGQSRSWRWQLCGPRSAEECAAGSGHKWSICCHLGRWLCCHLGQSTLWRWQLCGPRSADESLVQGVINFALPRCWNP